MFLNKSKLNIKVYQGAETADDDPQSILAHNTDGISFPKMNGLSSRLKSILSRLHRNLGHPHASDLKKMLAMNGIKDQKIYDAVEALTCESCLRVKGPSHAGFPKMFVFSLVILCRSTCSM